MLATKDSVATITKNATLTSSHCECEIVHDISNGLTGKCVLDMEADAKVLIDKTKLSSLFKADGSWPLLKVEKRAVDVVDI